MKRLLKMSAAAVVAFSATAAIGVPGASAAQIPGSLLSQGGNGCVTTLWLNREWWGAVDAVGGGSCSINDARAPHITIFLYRGAEMVQQVSANMPISSWYPSHYNSASPIGLPTPSAFGPAWWQAKAAIANASGNFLFIGKSNVVWN